MSAARRPLHPVAQTGPWEQKPIAGGVLGVQVSEMAPHLMKEDGVLGEQTCSRSHGKLTVYTEPASLAGRGGSSERTPSPPHTHWRETNAQLPTGGRAEVHGPFETMSFQENSIKTSSFTLCVFCIFTLCARFASYTNMPHARCSGSQKRASNPLEPELIDGGALPCGYKSSQCS